MLPKPKLCLLSSISRDLVVQLLVMEIYLLNGRLRNGGHCRSNGTSHLQFRDHSPWEIEPFSTSALTPTPTQPHSKSKRSRPVCSSISASRRATRPMHHSNSSINRKELEQTSNFYFQVDCNARNPETPFTTVTSCCRLFGFDLMSKPASAPVPPDKQQLVSVDSSNFGSTKCQYPNSSSSLNDLKQQTSTRSRTKVQMQGTLVGRAVDLTLSKSYDELISELEKMFEIEGELNPKDTWDIVFTDDESSDEVKKMSSRSLLDDEGAIVNELKVRSEILNRTRRQFTFNY
ncbi:unnamed protein product, partial [Thlaspi arvense]